MRIEAPQGEPVMSVPSPKRQAQLEAAYASPEKRIGSYAEVAISTLGELQWIFQQRHWSGMEGALPDGMQRPNLKGAQFLFMPVDEVPIGPVDSATFVMYGVNLSGALLYEANLDGTLLIKADLSRADLRRTNLKNFMSRSTLREAKLDDAILVGGNLKGADLSGASLVRADLGFVDLEDTQLANCNLTDTKFEFFRGTPHWPALSMQEQMTLSREVSALSTPAERLRSACLAVARRALSGYYRTQSQHPTRYPEWFSLASTGSLSAQSGAPPTLSRRSLLGEKL